MKYLLPIAIFMIFIFLTTCKKDCADPFYEKKYLTQEEKAFVPYSGNDSIVFVSDSGVEARFYGRGRNSYFDEEDDISGSGRCEYLGTYAYENDTIGFVCHSQNMTIELMIEYGPQFFININNKKFFISYNYLPEFDSITINNKTYYNVYYKISWSISSSDTSYLYYNQQIGIIRFILPDKTSWFL